MKITAPCPVCGYEDFETYHNSSGQATALYCNNCPYGLEDSRYELKDLIKIHDRIKDKNK